MSFVRVARRVGHPRQARQVAGSVPPTGLVLLSVVSVQLGSALATNLFHALGPGGAVFLRIGFAALVLLLAWRPRLRGYRRADYVKVVLFGLVLAGMNSAFYAAMARIPLGIAVTVEFVGPLGVAVAGSRRPLDVLWVLLAAGGIILLAPVGGTALDPGGLALALLAGVLWGAYILLNVRIGRAFPGGVGLALAMSVAALVLAPLGVLSGGAALLDPHLLLGGAGVALLSSVIPFSLELEALRRLPARVFGVLLSIEPAVAALIGFVLLGQVVQPRALVAIALVTAASLGASRQRGHGEANGGGP